MKKYIKIAVTQTKVPFTIQQGEAQVMAFVKKAKQNRVDVLGLPEDCICGLQDTVGDYNALAFIEKLAKESKISIFGSNVLKETNGKYYQTGFFFNQGGKLLSKTHKIILTPPEITVGINAGKSIQIFSTDFGKMAILICKDAFNRYTPIWVSRLKSLGVDYLLVPSVSLKVDQNSIRYWRESLWLLARNFDINIIASGTVGKNYTKYPSFGYATIISKDIRVEKEGSETKEEMLITKIRTRAQSEIKKDYQSKWQPIKSPKINIIHSYINK